MLKQPELFKSGYRIQSFQLPGFFQEMVKLENWAEVDRSFRNLILPGGMIFDALRNYHDFNSIEFIISIRDSSNDWEEDGIWHDDGSRVFAFSLSLTPEPKSLSGGLLEMRRKKEPDAIAEIPTPPYGTAILFLTGIHGFEHRTRAVKNGRRIVIAGWCS